MLKNREKILFGRIKTDHFRIRGLRCRIMEDHLRLRGNKPKKSRSMNGNKINLVIPEMRKILWEFLKG